MSAKEIVKIQRPLNPPDARELLIYDKTKKKARVMDPEMMPTEVLAALQYEPKVFWWAEWRGRGWRRFYEQAEWQTW